MRVLVFGGGQLARMMYLAGCPLGMHVRAVDVSKDIVINPISKAPSKLTLAEAIEDTDVITVEFEHVPERLLEIADQTGKLSPSIQSIRVGADRVKEKSLLTSLNIANCEHQIFDDVEALPDVIKNLGMPIVLKASRDGYDGYGQWRIKQPEDVQSVTKELAKLDLKRVPIVAEKMINFDRELSLVGVRSSDGKFAFYPLAENRHHEGQLHLSIAPAPQISTQLQQQAEQYFIRLAENLNYVGVLAVEFFQVGAQLLVNEIAPRVHNSGHWTIQGADTCQFENHLRAICGLPLGSTEFRSYTAMVNIIGGGSFSREMLGIPGCHLHWYGKSPRPKRKLGHFNVSGDCFSALGARLTDLSEHLPEEHFPLLTEGAADLQKL
ncbi:MAG: 5-(carboxyamino)imidazole ribonucleotide synthase [Alteromonadaceae bacterium]|nr:5-(carboxyamino)imidazole ribonucleotide synthase [Alteromonadaceae bacterium]